MRHFDQNFDPDYVCKKSLSQRGPFSGNGRGAGRPWGGIVEETPVLWVTWITQAAKKAGSNPQGLKVFFYGAPLIITSARLTFGNRYYWQCPICHRRCEAVYFNGSVGCRECLNLGYLSEAHRPLSAFAVLDRLFSRDFPFSRRYNPPDEAGAIVAGLRKDLERRISELVEAVKVE